LLIILISLQGIRDLNLYRISLADSDEKGERLAQSTVKRLKIILESKKQRKPMIYG